QRRPGRGRRPRGVGMTLVCIDTSEILEGKLDAVRTAIADMAAFVEANEPDVIAYEVFLDDAGTLMTVLQVHPDPASMERHMDIAAPAFAPFRGLIRLATIDVYGDPSERLLEQLGRKSSMLGDAPVRVHRLAGGVARFAATDR
ncbi:MAG TPA: hypothetical protein VF044_10260, partial [Actinomycetota bacterium]